MRTEITFWLVRLHRAYHTIAWDQLHEHGYYPVQEWLVLELLDQRRGEQSFSALKRRLGMSEASLSRMISRMKRGGLIETGPDPYDRRETLVHASHLARMGEEPLRHTVTYIEDCMWSALSPTERGTLNDLMQRAAGLSKESARAIQRNRDLQGQGIPTGEWEPSRWQDED